MTNTKSVNLSIGSRIISHLGEALIENEKVALLELIKNASDADANTCTVTIDTAYKSEYGEGRIVIEDDGSGMNLFIIENGFLKIATSIKQRYQKISPKFKRLAQGNKGIGRLALNQLGEYLIVTTKLDTSLINDDQLINDQKIVDVYGNRDRKELYAENLNVYYEFSINWKKYDSFLDLLSMRMKTNRNKIVSFAADFKKEYEKIYNRYIDDVSIHQYFVSSNG